MRFPESMMDQFSLIMTAFEGKSSLFDEEEKSSLFEETVEKELNRKGFDAFSLCVGGSKYLPAEIADNLPYQEAVRIAELLEARGATIQVIATENVKGVRYRADECWANHIAGDWGFTEVEGAILTSSPLNARHNVQLITRQSPDIERWQLEHLLNHEHPTFEDTRNGLRVAREMGEELTAALREAYPERGFVIAYYDEQVSFYQRGNNAPEGDEPPRNPLPEQIFCEVCKKRSEYRLRLEADPEFPKAVWGDCAVCGSELLLDTWEVRVCLPPLESPEHSL